MTAPLAILLSVAAASLAIMAARDVARPRLGAPFWLVLAATIWPPVGSVIASVPVAKPLAQGMPFFLLQFLPLFVVSSVLLIRAAIAGRRSFGIAALAVSLVTSVVTVASVLIGQAGVHGLLAVVVLWGCASVAMRSESEFAVIIVWAVVALCVLPAVYALLLPGYALRTDCQGNTAKCEMLGGFISIGQFSASNAFGITLAMLAGFVVFQLQWSRALTMTAAIVLGCLVTGARLATVCALACCVVALIAKVRWGRGVVLAAVGVAATSSIVLAVVPFPPHFFTDRATLWGRARQMFLEAPWFGHGLSFWVRDAATQPPPPSSYSPHNLWADLAVASGLLGIAVLVAAVILGLRLTAEEARIPALLLLTGVLVAGCFESTLMPFRINPVPAGMVVFFAYLSAVQDRHRYWRLLRRLAPNRPASPAGR